MLHGDEGILYTDGVFIALAHDNEEEVYCLRIGLRLMERDESDKLFEIEQMMENIN